MHALGKVGLGYAKFFHSKENATKKSGTDMINGFHKDGQGWLGLRGLRGQRGASPALRREEAQPIPDSRFPIPTLNSKLPNLKLFKR